MTHKAKEIRFRTNPVEFVIFFGITGLFAFSLYNLLYDRDQFQLANLEVEKVSVAANESATDRSPASSTTAFFPLTLECGRMRDQATHSAHVRFTIPLCHEQNGQLVKGGDFKLIQESSVTNTVNKATAVVYIDSNPLTTNPLELNPGKNTLHIEYSYRDGQKVSYDFAIMRE